MLNIVLVPPKSPVLFSDRGTPEAIMPAADAENWQHIGGRLSQKMERKTPKPTNT